MKHYFVGVDGGATKSIVRLEDEAGNLLGRAQGGSANIRISPEKAWQNILQTLSSLLAAQHLVLDDPNIQFHAAMGMAGCETELHRQNFLTLSHPFHDVLLFSDAYAACLGAHNGNDGMIIIAGTGAIGWQIQQGKTSRVSGWGFPYDDEGSGAWLGLRAIQVTLESLDGRGRESALTRAVHAHFEHDREKLVLWASAAGSMDFAALARIVIEMSGQDAVAKELLQQAALAIEAIANALIVQQTTPLTCVLLGGIAATLVPYLSPSLQKKLVPCQQPADAGALIYLRQSLKEKL